MISRIGDKHKGEGDIPKARMAFPTGEDKENV